MSGARYAEHRPPPALTGLVECGWTLTCDDPLLDHRVLPDGCIDLVLGAGAEPTVAGPATTAFMAPLPARGFAAGIRFHPGAAAALLGLPAAELLNLHVPLAELWGRDAAGPVAQAPDAATALIALRDALVARLPDAADPDPAVRAAATALAADPSVPVARLARAVALSERQLRRRFHAHVGYGPKRLGRVLRLRRLLEHSGDPWALRALSAGYADQAHMIRECVELAGVPPTRLAPAA